MAENIVDALTGGERQEEEGDAGPTDGLHTLAAVVAADMSRDDPEVAAKKAIFLDHQTQVLEAQKLALDDDHKRFVAERTPRLIGLWLKTGFQVLTALAATLLGIGALVMLSDAINSRSVIVESFDAPPALAASGLSGKVVAGDVLDELIRLHAATRTNAAKRPLANDWTGDIKIEVPETGVSLGEIGRLLHKWLGHDLHISGDLVQTEARGLVLTVRGDGVLPKAFPGGAGDLAKLTTQAAEYDYGESQPGLFSFYLNQMNRDDDVIAFAKFHLARASLADQPRLLNSWADAISAKGGPQALVQALALWREAVRIKPDFWTGYNNIIYGLAGLGDEEGAVQGGRQMLKAAGGRPGNAPEDRYANYDTTIYDLPAYRAETIADVAATGGTFTSAAAMLSVAQADALLHEVGTARLRLRTTVWDPKSHPDAANAALAEALLAEELGDLPAAVKAWDDYGAAYADPKVSTANPQEICWAAPTYQRTGQPAKADAALDAPMKAVGIGTFVDCYRFRGDVLDLRGDWTGAQAWYARAVKLAPDIPSGSYSWGMALYRRGDLAGAAARFAAANQAGPHWADPLKAWGDVLMREGKARAALAKYDQALEYAPLWKQLQQARAAAARRAG